MSYQFIPKFVDGKKEGNSPNVICRKSDRATIPFDPANIDYQEYLAWIAEGNTPEPFD
jgi:hypothetical protein|tara:strand:- start:11 stop:184 length:174 start_codon:yes stop_codon:yes gene_type:complete